MDYDQAAWYEARGGAQRTGPGVGCGLFDSDLTGTDLRADRWGRNYRDVDPQGQKRWTLQLRTCGSRTWPTAGVLCVDTTA